MRAYVELVAHRAPELSSLPGVDEELEAQARVILVGTHRRLTGEKPHVVADVAPDELGRRRAQRGIHPSQSLLAADALFTAVLPELTRFYSQRGGSETAVAPERVALALQSAISERLVGASLSYVDVMLEHLSKAHLNERRRISRDLHDRTSHGIGAAIAGINLVVHHVERGESPDLARVAALREVLLDTLNEVRAMASRLRDTVGDRTLGQALEEHLDIVAPPDVIVEVEDHLSYPVAAHIAEELYLIVREAIRNALVHGAGATRVSVRLSSSPGALKGEVTDNGAGFDPSTVEAGRTVGLASMRERAEGLGGTMSARSTPGAGAQIVVRVPLLAGFASNQPHGQCAPGTGCPIRLLLADDHQIFRESLASLLAIHDEVAVVALAGTGSEAVTLTSAHAPDVVLLDVDMPGQSVMTTLAELKETAPETRVIILTMHENGALAQQLLVHGASAYLAKTIGHRELVAAITACMEREPALVTMSLPRRSLPSVPGEAVISPREVQVLVLVAQAHSNQQIASRLSINETTVKRHLSNINLKLGSSSRFDAVRRAVKLRLIDVSLDS